MIRDLRIFLFFHFADDMGVCFFWVCPTTPMSAAGTIYIYIIISKKMKHIFKYIYKYNYTNIKYSNCVKKQKTDPSQLE